MPVCTHADEVVLQGTTLRRAFGCALLAFFLFPAWLAAAPANDNFNKSTSIASGGGTVTGSNVGAGKQSGEPNHGGNPGGKSVWWSWTATSNASVTVSTNGSAFDTLLGVYTGSSVGNLTTRGSNDDIGINTTSALAFNASSGTTYYIAVDGWSDPNGGTAESGNISLTLTVGGSTPSNDAFANAATIAAAGGSATGSNVNATREGGEPIFAGDAGERSVWWKWTPSQSGSALIATSGSSFDTILGVFTGSAVDSLSLVGDNDDAGDETTSSVVVGVTAGTTYRIAVDGFGGEAGSVSLSVQLVPNTPPANDNFSSAASIPGGGGDVTGSNVNATSETNEPAHAGVPATHSLWWKWTAPSDGTVGMSTAGSTFDTVLGVYTGSSVGALTEVTSNDDDPGYTTSVVSFNAVSGTTYRIAVDGWSGEVGSVALATTFVPNSAPMNDAFANSISIPSMGGSATGSNVGATKEANEPNHAGNPGGHSVWWTWTATDNGTATITTSGSGFDTLLGVYTGSSVAGLVETASNNDFGGSTTSRVQFAAASGTTYRIAVDGNGGAVGNVAILVQFTSALAPANDAFINAITIAANGGSDTGTNVGATKEAGEPAHAGNTGGHSVWWEWTAPANGTTVISTSGSAINTLLGVYSGTSVDALDEVASNDDDGGNTTSRVEFAAESGAIYRIAVDGSGGAQGGISISLQFTANPPPENDDFANATTIASEGGNTFGSNLDSTKESGEPNHAGNSGGHSVWWKWTAPASGVATISTVGSDFDTLLGVYTGSSVNSLAEVASNDDDGANSSSQVVFDVVPGTTYRIAVDGFNDGTTIASGLITLSLVRVDPPPAVPVANAATGIAYASFTANWSSVSGATGYRIDVSTSNTFSSFVSGFQNLDAGNVTSIAVTGLSASTNYYYRVRAYSAAGTSSSSSTITATTSIAPPAQVTATAATSILVSGFTANWNAVSGATGYRIDVSASSSFSNYISGWQNNNVGNVTGATINGLSAATTYYYRVRAYNGSGTGTDSSTITVVTAVPAPGGTTSSAATNVTTTGFTANWSATSGATGYKIDVSTNNTFSSFVTGYQEVDAGNLTHFDVTGLSSSTTYYYRVRAYNGTGTGSNSLTITVATGSDPVPGQVTASAATNITTSGFTANWSSVGGATGYRIDVSANSSFSSFVSGWQNNNVNNVTGVAINGLPSSTTFYYRVRAYNANGSGASSAAITVTTASPPPPSAPTAAAATSITTSGFTANWSSVSGATGYRVDVSTSSSFSSYVSGWQDLNAGNTTGIAVSGLSASTTYYYRVRAYSANGSSGNSSTITVTTSAPPPPSAPTATAATSVTASGFTANWSSVSGATGYRIDVSTSSTFSSYVAGYQDLDAGNATSVAVVGLSASSSYYYRVRAYGASGTSSNSGTITTTTAEPPPPDAPAAGAASSITNTGFVANWSLASGATGYVIDVSTNSAFSSYVTGWKARDVGNVSSAAIGALQTGTTYYYRVRAYNNSGNSADSKTITVTTTSAPFAGLTNISARASAGSGGNTLIIGFYISGTAPKTLVIRGVGPELGKAPFNLPNVVADPAITIYKGQTIVDSNDDWDSSLAPDFTAVGAFALTPGSKDAALKVTLDPGLYSVLLQNPGDVAEAIIEVYDLSKNSTSHLSNVSCRLKLNKDQTIILGSYLENKTTPILFRNVGPTLHDYDPSLVTLPDPFLRLYSGSTEIGSNDDWDPALAPYFASSGAFSLTPGSKDAALRPTLGSGGITVHASGKGGEGVTLVELYDSN